MAPVETVVPYYTATATPQMAINLRYDFQIVLSDSHPIGYTASIQTQAEDLVTFSAPTSVRRSQPFTVSWGASQPENEYVLGVIKELRDDSAKISFAVDAIPVANPSASSYTFPANYFGNNVRSARLSLSAKKFGTIDSRFRAGSYIVSTLKVERNILIEN